MNILTQSTDTKMTSQQIADLVGSRHDTVKKSIERMIGRGVISKPPMADGIKAANGVATQVYIFSGEQGRLDSIVVVAQLSPEFTAALVKRWDELERGAAPAIQIPQSFSESLQLAADQAKQLELAAPKIHFYDTVAERDNLMTVTQVATKLGMSAQALNKRLTALGAYDGRIKRCKTFTSEFVAKGYGEMKVGSTGHDQGLITQNGQAWIVGLFGE